MVRLFALLACLALAVAIAFGAARTPAPRAGGSGTFSGLAAMADVRTIAAHPHPIGSAEHDRVRDYVARRFQDMGLQVRIADGQSYERRVYGGESWIEGGHVQNIVAVLPGGSRSAPAVLVMAHYDTVAASPGAADDTVGVAAALETARALTSAGIQGPRARDVIFLITDGEEAGLLGARAFFAGDRLARHVGAVVNMESRGGGGRAYMFETGVRNGGMIDLFRRTAVRPSASSLTGFVYAHMDNDTDFTVAKTQGLPGLNFAFIGRPFDYHAASSTSAALDQGSLQHIGDQVLAAVYALANANELPAKRADSVYSDVLGGFVIAYPAWAGWAVLAAAAALAGLALTRAFKAEPARLSDVLRGTGAVLLATVAGGGLFVAARALTAVPLSFVGEKALFAGFWTYEAALAFAALAAAVLAFRLAGLGRPRYWSAFAGAFGLVLILAATVQALAPEVDYLLAWPLVASGAIAAALAWRWDGAWTRPSAVVFAALAGALVLGHLLYVADALTLGVGAELPAAMAVLMPMAAVLLFPLLWPAQGERGRTALAVVALALALALTLALRFTDPFSAGHPRPTEVVYAADLDTGRFLRATPLPGREPWTLAALRADGGKVARAALAPFAGHVQAAAARPVAVERPEVSAVRGPDGRVTVRLAPKGPARQLVLDLRATGSAGAATIEGLPFPLAAGRWTHLAWDAPRDGLTVSFGSAPTGSVELRYAQIADGWPADARPLVPRPAAAMPWMDSDSTVLVGSLHSAW